MKYRLKDRELQEKLDAISGGDFSEKLNTEAQKMFSPVLARETFRVYFGDFDALVNRFSVLFELDEVEEIPGYDPHKWNIWPDVEPPEGVLMRAEIFFDRDDSVLRVMPARYCKKTSAEWDGSAWISFGEVLDEDEIEKIRFRPWDDPDEEAVG